MSYSKSSNKIGLHNNNREGGERNRRSERERMNDDDDDVAVELQPAVLSVVREVLRSCSDELVVTSEDMGSFRRGSGKEGEGGGGETSTSGRVNGGGETQNGVGVVMSTAENRHRVEVLERRLREAISSRGRELAKREAEFARTTATTFKSMDDSLAELGAAMELVREMEADLETVQKLMSGQGHGDKKREENEDIFQWDVNRSAMATELVHGNSNVTAIIRSIEDLEGVPALVSRAREACRRLDDDDANIVSKLTPSRINYLSTEFVGLYSFYALHHIALGTAQREDNRIGRRRSAQLTLLERDEIFESTWNLYRSVLFAPLRAIFEVASHKPQILVATAKAVELHEMVQMHYLQRLRAEAALSIGRDVGGGIGTDVDDGDEEALELDVNENLVSGCAGSFRQKLLNVVSFSIDERCMKYHGFERAVAIIEAAAKSPNHEAAPATAADNDGGGQTPKKASWRRRKGAAEEADVDTSNIVSMDLDDDDSDEKTSSSSDDDDLDADSDDLSRRNRKRGKAKRRKGASHARRKKDNDEEEDDEEEEEDDPAATGLDKAFVAGIIEKAWTIMNEIVFANDYIVPCFPDYYSLTTMFAVRFHVNLTYLMETVAGNANSLSNSEIVTLLEWAETYTSNVSSLFEGSEKMMQPPVSETLRPLINEYSSRSRDMMAAWSQNVLKREMETAPSQIGSKYYTPGGIDLFQIVGSQISAVLRDEDLFGSIKASLLGPLIAESGTVLKQFAESQAAFASRVSRERGDRCLERLCALANNQLRSYKESVELAEQTAELMYTYLDLDEAASSFLECASAAIGGIVDVVYVDIVSELRRLFTQCSDAEEAAEVSATIVATFEDYYGDLKSWLEKSMWKQLAVASFERFAVQFIAVYLASSPSMPKDVLVDVLPDVVEEAVAALSVDDVDTEKVEPSMRALSSIMRLASASPTKIAAAYDDILLEDAPVEVKVIESLFEGPRRQEVEPADVQEIVAACTEVFEDRKKDATTEVTEDSVWGRVHQSIQKAKGWNKLRRKKTTLVVASSFGSSKLS